jgi:hypothetical protein
MGEHAAAGRRRRPRGVERAELRQELRRAGERGGRRRIQPAEAPDVAQPPGRELEDGSREVDADDLGRLVLAPSRVLRTRPEPDAAPGAEPAGAPPALRGGRAADRAKPQVVEARAGVEAQDARQARVDDGRHAVDRERRLRHVGREDDAAAGARAERPRLLVEWLVPVQRQHVHAGRTRERRERGGGAPDLGGAGQEHQDVAIVLERRPHRGRYPLRQRAALPGRVPLDRDRVLPPLGGHDRAAAQVGGQGLGLERRRHDDEAQVGTHRLLQLADDREREVALQVALVELVEDDDPDLLEERVAHQVAAEDALGEEPEARRRPAPAREADAVADVVAGRATALARDELRGRARGDPARLDDDDLPRARHAGVE